MNIEFREASVQDAETIADFVIKLTNEISELSTAKAFELDLAITTENCRALIDNGHYAAIIAMHENSAIAVVTISQTYALYAKGKVGVIQEFYVTPKYRKSGVGSMLIEQVKNYGKQHKWSCIELCTPPLPEFESTLNFYQKNGLTPVGGRKMRQALV